MTGKRTSIALVAIMLVSVVGIGLVAAASPSDELNFAGDDPAPNPRFDTDVTVSKHPMTEGTSASSMAGYFDDEGDWVDDPVFVVNTTTDESVQSTMNKYTYDPAKVEDDDWAEFPRADDEEGDNSASILDSDEWNQQSGTPTISDATLASGVDGVNLDMASTDVASYANWSSEYDSDESKRVLQVGGEVNSMDAATDLNITLEDESGDKKTVQIDPDDSQSTDITTAYGQSSGTFFYQVKLSNVPFDSGSGTWENIQSVNVTANGGAADVSLSRLAFAKKSKTNLGDRAVDYGDDDSDFDQTNETYNATGTISIKSLASMDAEFDDASITDVTFPAQYRMQDLEGTEGEEETFVINTRDAEDYPSYDTILNVSARMELPAQIDLSFASNQMVLEQQYPSGRYLELGTESDVSESANLSQASLTDHTGSLGSVGDEVELLGSPSSDTWYITHYEVKLTEPEAENALGTGDEEAGGGGQFADGGSGGALSFLFSVPGMIIGGILTALGLRKASGSGA